MTTVVSDNKVKTVLMCCPGRFQAYFANSLVEHTDLLGIIVVEEQLEESSFKALLSKFKNKQQYIFKPWLLISQIYTRLKLNPYEADCEEKLATQFPHVIENQTFPNAVPIQTVDNINSVEAVNFVEKLNPELICVNGTNLLREPMLVQAEKTPYGCVNLHTGLSPHTRGGNCNLNAILEAKPELVGSTVHYIDAGIDSGDIICTSRPHIKADDNYEFAEAKVFIEGIDKFIEAIPFIVKGQAPRVEQWTEGKLYLKRTGYEYHPRQRLQANHKINGGLFREYVANKASRDEQYSLVELNSGLGK